MASRIDNDKYDEIFMQIAGQIGSVQGLLDEFFGFMHRKTDFYVEFEESDVKATMGFPKGAAEKMIIKSFRKKKMKNYSSQVDGIAGPYTNIEDGSITSGISDKRNMISENAGINRPLIPSAKIKHVDLNSKGQQMPIGNGGVADNYYWTQTLTEVTVYIDAESASRGKEIDCIISPKSLKLVVLGNVLIDGEFEEAVRVDESMWTLNIGNKCILESLRIFYST